MDSGTSIRTVLLKRGARGYGFNLAEQYPSYLSAVHSGGAADLAGLRVGDVVLALNGIDVRMSSHREIVDIVASSGAQLQLTVRAIRRSCTDACQALNIDLWRRRRKVDRFANLVTPLSNSSALKAAMTHPPQAVPNHEDRRREVAPYRNLNSGCLQTSLLVHAGDDSSSDSSFLEPDVGLLFQAVLVYIGSVPVALPLGSKRRCLRLALHSLKAQRARAHTVLMKAYSEDLTITNSRGFLISHLKNSSVMFVAASSENKQYFCVTTLDDAEDSISGNQSSSTANESPPRSSSSSSVAVSHVFTVDPELRSHSCHYLYARRFGIKCTRGTVSSSAAAGAVRQPTGGLYSCLEFPDTCGVVLASLSALIGPAAVRRRQRTVVSRSPNAKQRPLNNNLLAVASQLTERPGEAGPKGVTVTQCTQPSRSDSGDQVLPMPVTQRREQSSSSEESSSSGNWHQKKLCRRPLGHHQPGVKALSLCQDTAEGLRAMHLSNGDPSLSRSADDFDQMLRDPRRLDNFMAFLRKEFSHENIEFWLDVEKYRRCQETKQRQTLGKQLYRTYFASDAVKPINVDSEAQQMVKRSVEAANFQPCLFDDAQRQIHRLMKFDCYRRFLTSQPDEEEEQEEEETPAQPVVAAAQEDSPASALRKSRRRRRSLPFLAWRNVLSSRRKSAGLKEEVKNLAAGT